MPAPRSSLRSQLVADILAQNSGAVSEQKIQGALVEMDMITDVL